MRHVLSVDQRIFYSSIYEYFDPDVTSRKDTPDLVTKLNPFIDDGLIKIKSKVDRWKDHSELGFPILMSNESKLTSLIIHDTHERFSHSGCYAILTSLRKKFWIPKCFSTVKKVIKNCIVCKRFNHKTVKLNQSPYRDFRMNPESYPYRNIFIDYLGPMYVRSDGVKKKVWILVITCLWSRAVNLIVCNDLTVKSFLRALQTHIYQYGLPTKIFSDLGSQIVSGASIIADFIKSVEIVEYLQSNGISSVKFEQYFKGNSSLGSVVEICVKFTKKLIYSSIRKNVLDRPDFDLLIAQTICILNKRPLTFKEYLRSDFVEYFPSPITPELLITGRDSVTLDVIPSLSFDKSDGDFEDYSSDSSLVRDFAKLQGIRSRLSDVYNTEFQNNLLNQAVDKNNRFDKVNHIKLTVGDIVLLKEDNCKSVNYPMAIVREVFSNEQDEVTAVKLLKGSTREIVKRHVNAVIPLIKNDGGGETKEVPSEIIYTRPPSVRKAAINSRFRTKQLF